MTFHLGLVHNTGAAMTRQDRPVKQLLLAAANAPSTPLILSQQIPLLWENSRKSPPSYPHILIKSLSTHYLPRQVGWFLLLDKQSDVAVFLFSSNSHGKRKRLRGCVCKNPRAGFTHTSHLLKGWSLQRAGMTAESVSQSFTFFSPDFEWSHRAPPCLGV